MNSDTRRLFSQLAASQHGVAAVWQLLERRVRRSAIDRWIRIDRPPRVHRGVYGEPDPLGHLMAAVLAAGPGAALSHGSALGLRRLRDHPEGDVAVSVPGSGSRQQRDGFRIHRVRPFESQRWAGIPVTDLARSLVDARLPRHEAYRALEAAEAARLHVDHDALTGPALREVKEVLRLGMNRTRSDAEARFIFLCSDHGIEMPVVNHRLNGVEADFHWPRARLVVEVDGWEFHRERRPFEEDRRRGVLHRINGFEVVRVSALQVRHTPAEVAAAVLASAPSLRVVTRSARARAA